MSIAAAAAVNDVKVLANCLERSPDVASGALPLAVYRDSASMSLAYNRAFDELDAEIMIFVHQDVYLPSGFVQRVQARVDQLAALDPDWAIAGVIGIDPDGRTRGQTWSSGLNSLIGEPVDAPTEAHSLDEVILVVRRSAGLRFDAAMPGFHLYGADIVQTARSRGLKSYVVDLPLVHHSRPTVQLDGHYRKVYRYMQRKWRRYLPLPNLICPIHASMIPLLIKDFRIRKRYRGNTARAEPKGDPVAIARSLQFETAD